jgi:3-hydroxypropanoate dehydrogenase
MNVTTEQLFGNARTQNGFVDEAIADASLHQLFELMKWGPTAANCSPARIVFVRSPEPLARQARGKVFPRSPRLSFDDACRIA